MRVFELPDLPSDFAEVRDRLHQIAFYAISPARYRAEGRMGLRHHQGGFGTPESGGRTIRVLGDEVVVDEGEDSSVHTISTVRAAIEFLGHEYDQEWFADFHDPLDPLPPDEPLYIDPDVTDVLGEWFGFAWVVLEDLRALGTPEDQASEVQLWPEHFDAATELGDHEKGQRASYGASPGDADHLEPYVYVSAWSEIDGTNPFWNDEFFNGASLSYSELVASDDPVETALEFLLEGYRILHRSQTAD